MMGNGRDYGRRVTGGIWGGDGNRISPPAFPPLPALDAVLQARPGRLDLFHLPKAVRPEGINRALVARSFRLYSELPVERRQDELTGWSYPRRPSGSEKHRPLFLCLLQYELRNTQIRSATPGPDICGGRAHSRHQPRDTQAMEGNGKPGAGQTFRTPRPRSLPPAHIRIRSTSSRETWSKRRS